MVRLVSLFAAVLAGGFGILLIGGASIQDTMSASVLYAAAAILCGAVLAAAAFVNRGRTRLAWGLVGAGTVAWGLGEVIWMVQARSGEIPYPGVADFLYVAGYPLIFAGVILLPYLRPGRFERIRLAIDATVGTLSLAVLMWVAYLGNVVSLGSNPVETFLNVLYPFGDVLLVTALMVLAMRRSEERLDLRVYLLAGGIALTAVADVIFSLQIAADTYVEWGSLDGWWMLSYGMFALAAAAVTRPAARQGTTYRSANGWQLVAPYSAVAALFAVRLITATGNDLLLNVATTAVACMIMVRQHLSIRERRELLEQQRDDLVASVSHELRTPLTGIRGFAQLLSESWEQLGADERQEMLVTINTQADHLGHIVNDLVDVARDRLQNVTLSRTAYEAEDLVHEAVAATGGGGNVSLDLAPDVTVSADVDRVRQVLVNLITNADRYGRSQILITVSQVGSMARFAVHDNGDGVPAKFQSTMWDRFERGLHAGNNAVGGSGIGLSVVRDLVAAHGGEIGYRTSEILGGACFEFTIPVVVGAGKGETVSAA